MVIILNKCSETLELESSQRFFADWNSATVLYSIIIITPRTFVLLIGLKFNGPQIIIFFCTLQKIARWQGLFFLKHPCKDEIPYFKKRKTYYGILDTHGFMTKLTVLKFHLTSMSRSLDKPFSPKFLSIDKDYCCTYYLPTNVL